MSDTPETDLLIRNLFGNLSNSEAEICARITRKCEEMERQRNELLAALEAIIANEQPYNELEDIDRERAVAALKRAKGETP